VVLLNHGGPSSLADVEPFLYRLFMDPALIDLPIGPFLRHWMCKAMARLRASSIAEDYEVIGGSSPINRLTREQSRSLQKHLNATFGRPSGITFRTYVAMRYWHPFSEEAARQMADDGVDQVVLLPLYPHWSKTTSGSSIAYWHALEEAGEIPSWPTTSVFEYAAHPKYVQAVSERIDEALQRFPSGLRDDVHLLFSGYGTSMREVTDHGDPYRCHLRTTVEEVMNLREDDRTHDVAFQGGDGFTEWLSPSTSEVLERLGSGHAPPVLVVPISYLTDHVETHYELDIAVREEAEAAGIDHFEVSSGLNAHPLLVEALAEATVSQIRLPVEAEQLAAFENGEGDPVFPRTRNRQGEADADDPQRSCPADRKESAARRWTPLSPSESTASSVSSG
jgi:ferrochelatase